MGKPFPGTLDDLVCGGTALLDSLTGWAGRVADPRSPQGAGGPGRFRIPGTVGGAESLLLQSLGLDPGAPANQTSSVVPLAALASPSEASPSAGEASSDAKAVKDLSVSTEGINLLKTLEEGGKARLKPYDDQTSKDITEYVKGATIGYGHLIEKSEWEKYKNGITEADAETILTSDISPAEKAVKKAITVSLEQCEYEALVFLAFNIGAGGFGGSSVVKLVNDPKAKTDYKDLEAAWMAWNKSQGTVMKGLDNRRKAEWKLYDKGEYE